MDKQTWIEVGLGLLVLFTLVTVVAFNAHPDEFKIPFSCYPQEVQKFLAEHDRKLDLIHEPRTIHSWGYLFNKGSEFNIYTYKPATDEDMDILLELIHGN